MAERAARGDADAPRQEKIAYKAHVAIFEAIAMRDPDRAEMAMVDHMRQLEQTFWRQRGPQPADA